MTDFCEIHREDWEAYAHGELDAGVREEMSAHLRDGCAECAARFEHARGAAAALRRSDDAAMQAQIDAVYGAKPPRWKFWTVAPWVAAAVFFGLFLIAERAYLNLQKEMLDARQLNPVTNHIVHETHAQPAANAASGENDHDLQSTIEQLRASLDQANQQTADAQRDTVRYQTDLKAAQLQIVSLEGGVRGSEESRVKAETDAASIRMQLSKAQGDAHRAANLAAENQQMMKLLESPQLHQLALKTVGSNAGDANARVVWDNDRGLMLLAHDLPELAENHVYQLWIFRGGQPSMSSAGEVQVDSRGRGTAYLAPGDILNNFGGAVVTDEPSGGSTVPHGNQIFIARQ